MEKSLTDRFLRKLHARLLADETGTALIEAAICIPLVITLMVGAMNYGMWFMAAHSVQQAANEAARASLAAIDEEDREAIVEYTIEEGVLNAGAVRAEFVEWETSLEDNRFTVHVSYDIAHNPLLTSSLVPMPEGEKIIRSASVHLSSI
ncbi:TadE/TadG family type IV pilus assembly protein [Aurantiacibacter luteus]|uniref:TadE-like domain-containing protein n=1 Tax=Aurantiacibacter luteus TaxID=1581420 RepID=A0A0G9MYS3_9SPHN|nr:TadE family protein [Aurantiacibacter luteus]KLE35891.1 hypothetical protein AAW00_05905 [Aurantiacibacter luteus]